MSRRAIDLSSLDWQVGRVARQPFPSPSHAASLTPSGRASWSGVGLSDDREQVAEWLPARVPGDVRADLIAAARIPPVDTPEGIAAGRWVDDYDWWYRSTLSLPDVSGDDYSILLEADGIDYLSAICLDDELLTVHTGMFGRQVVLLSPRANRPGPHEVGIRIWGAGALISNSPAREALRRAFNAVLHPTQEHFSERMSTAKAQYSFGWDFAPRLLSTGIWDNIRVVLAHGAYIEDLWAYGDPVSTDQDPGPVRWHINLKLRRWEQRDLQAHVMIEPENFGGGYQTMTRTLELCPTQAPPCIDTHIISLDMPMARLWWPWDQGQPCLYRITVRLSDEHGPIDEICRCAGARSVRREALPDGAPWRFAINDRPIFLRGANWAPADMLPGRLATKITPG